MLDSARAAVRELEEKHAQKCSQQNKEGADGKRTRLAIEVMQSLWNGVRALSRASYQDK